MWFELIQTATCVSGQGHGPVQPDVAAYAVLSRRPLIKNSAQLPTGASHARCTETAVRRLVTLLHAEHCDPLLDDGVFVLTNIESEKILAAVHLALDELASAHPADLRLQQALCLVHEAADDGNGSTTIDALSWPSQLAAAAMRVHSAWSAAPPAVRQADISPLLLLCASGQLIARLGTLTVDTSLLSRKEAAASQRVLCALSAPDCGRLLAASLAAHVQLFRWHEAQPVGDDCVAARLAAALQCWGAGSAGEPHAAAEASAAAAAAATDTQRLLQPGCVPKAHEWLAPGGCLLPLPPQSQHWAGGREVLVGMHVLATAAQGLPATPPHTAAPAPELLPLLSEGFWLFAQERGSTYRPVSTTGAAELPQRVPERVHSTHLNRLWDSCLPRLLTALRPPHPTDGSAATAAQLLARGVAPAAPVLLGMLAAALRRLDAIWRQPTGECTPALRALRLEMAAQATDALKLVQQLATVVHQLLRLEHDALDAAGGDSSAPPALWQAAGGDSSAPPALWQAAGGDSSAPPALWQAAGGDSSAPPALWQAAPEPMAQLLELLLRSPGCPLRPATMLVCELLRGVWAAAAATPALLLHPSIAAALTTARKALLAWQAALAPVALNPVQAAARGANNTAAAARTDLPAWMTAAVDEGHGASVLCAIELLQACVAGAALASKQGAALMLAGAVPAAVHQPRPQRQLVGSGSGGSLLSSSSSNSSDCGDDDSAADAAIEACGSPGRGGDCDSALAAAVAAAHSSVKLTQPLTHRAPKQQPAEVVNAELAVLVRAAAAAAALPASCCELLAAAASSHSKGAAPYWAVGVADALRGVTDSLRQTAAALQRMQRAGALESCAGAAVAAAVASHPADPAAAAGRQPRSEGDVLALSAALAAAFAGSEAPTGLQRVGCANPSCAVLRGESEASLRLAACRGCRAVAYCCRGCQVMHWRRGAHRTQCAALQAAADAEWEVVFSEDGSDCDDGHHLA